MKFLLMLLLTVVSAFVPAARPAFTATRLFMSDEVKSGSVKW